MSSEKKAWFVLLPSFLINIAMSKCRLMLTELISQVGTNLSAPTILVTMINFLPGNIMLWQ